MDHSGECWNRLNVQARNESVQERRAAEAGLWGVGAAREGGGVRNAKNVEELRPKQQNLRAGGHGQGVPHVGVVDGSRLADHGHLDLARVLEPLLDLAGDLVREQRAWSSSISAGLTMTRISRPAWSA